MTVKKTKLFLIMKIDGLNRAATRDEASYMLKILREMCNKFDLFKNPSKHAERSLCMKFRPILIEGGGGEDPPPKAS